MLEICALRSEIDEYHSQLSQLKEAVRWRVVKDGLPTSGKVVDVVIQCEDKRFVTQALIDGREWIGLSRNDEHANYSTLEDYGMIVTHWKHQYKWSLPSANL